MSMMCGSAGKIVIYRTNSTDRCLEETAKVSTYTQKASA